MARIFGFCGFFDLFLEKAAQTPWQMPQGALRSANHNPCGLACVGVCFSACLTSRRGRQGGGAITRPDGYVLSETAGLT
jgi:hypothetical protein